MTLPKKEPIVIHPADSLRMSPTELSRQQADAEGPTIIDGSIFIRRVRMAAYSLVLLGVVLYLLVQFRTLLQPLFVALFLGFLMQPIHRWLVRCGMRSLIAYSVIVFLALGIALGIGVMLYANFTEAAPKLPEYERRLEEMIRTGANRLQFDDTHLQGHFLREIEIAPAQLASAARAALGQFNEFTSWAGLTFLYLLFLIAEKVSAPNRLRLALGEQHGAQVLHIVESINQAISQYIAVKTLVSAMAGLLSYVVLAAFEVDFAATWGILIFLLNFIPYLGSFIALLLPIVLSFVQFEEIWRGLAIAPLLIGIQLAIGMVVEPRIAGQRLDVSPLLILLSLAFWFFVWGIVGAILAVPLLVSVKIILDNIPETKPIATLISNR